MKNNAIAEKVKLQPRTMNSFLLNKARIYYVFVTCETDVRPKRHPKQNETTTPQFGNSPYPSNVHTIMPSLNTYSRVLFTTDKVNLSS